MPYGRLEYLPHLTCFGIVDQPHWQSVSVRRSLRALSHEFSTPRDSYVVDVVCKTLQEGAKNSDESLEDEAKPRSKRKPGPLEALSGASSRWMNKTTGDAEQRTVYASLSNDSTSPAIRRFLDDSKDVFLALFSSGLPHIHRPVQAGDSDVIHASLLKAWENTAQQDKGEGGMKAPSVHVTGVERCKIIDTFSVWDATSVGAPAGSEGRKRPHQPDNAAGWDRMIEEGQEDGVDVIEIVEAGQNIAMKRNPELLPYPLRVCSTFFHYYQLLPPRRIVCQVTVAYEVTEGTKDKAVHTVTYEAQLGFPYPPRDGIRGLLGNILRFASPMAAVTPVSGWRVVDVDGWLARHNGPQKSCTFAPWMEEARSMSTRHAVVQESLHLEGIHHLARSIHGLPTLLQEEQQAVTQLRNMLAETPAGRGALLSITDDAVDEEKGESDEGAEGGKSARSPRRGGRGGRKKSQIAPAAALKTEGGEEGKDEEEDGVEMAHVEAKGVGRHGRVDDTVASSARHARALSMLQGGTAFLRVDGLLATQAAGLRKAGETLQWLQSCAEQGKDGAPWVVRMREQEMREAELLQMGSDDDRLHALTGHNALTGHKDRIGMSQETNGSSASSENLSASSSVNDAGLDSSLTPGPWPVRTSASFHSLVAAMDEQVTHNALMKLSQGEIANKLMHSARTRIAGMAGHSAVRIMDAKTSAFLASASSIEVIEGLCVHLSRYVKQEALMTVATENAVGAWQADGAGEEPLSRTSNGREAVLEAAKKGYASLAAPAEELAAHIQVLKTLARKCAGNVQKGTMRAEWAELRGEGERAESDSDSDDEEAKMSRATDLHHARHHQAGRLAGTPLETPKDVKEALDAAAELLEEEDSSRDGPMAVRRAVHARVMAVHAAARALVTHMAEMGLLDMRLTAEGREWPRSDKPSKGKSDE